MKTIKPILLVSVYVLPSVVPLIVGRSVSVLNNQQHEHGRFEGSTFGRKNTRAKNYHSLRWRLPGNTAMMAKPSQPVPVNVEDTVSSLRAAVQVLRGVHIVDRAV